MDTHQRGKEWWVSTFLLPRVPRAAGALESGRAPVAQVDRATVS
jgi:hypothetical protein